MNSQFGQTHRKQYHYQNENFILTLHPPPVELQPDRRSRRDSQLDIKQRSGSRNSHPRREMIKQTVNDWIETALIRAAILVLELIHKIKTP